MTKNAGGNEYTALVSALLGNILGIFIAPAMIYLFMKNLGLNVVNNLGGISNYGRVIATLSLTVLLPLIIGQIINRIWTEKVMWAKVKFHFSEVASLALLILVWSVLCNLFQSGALKAISSFEFLVLIVLNALFFVSFTLLALFIARLPNIFVCRKENRDEQSLLMEPQQKEATLIERWRFSREDTIAFMFCGATKTVANGAPLIAAIFAGQNQTLISLLTLPLILYHVEQLILCSIAVLFLQRWLKRHSLADKKELCQQ
jgi:sodium/bile acid cotransporter 7